MLKTAGFVLAVILSLNTALAQQVEVVKDTLNNPSDSLHVQSDDQIKPIDSYSKRFEPRKALLYSAVLPGMGQVYNKKYWKLPFVYGGFFVITSFAVAYNNLYNKYKTELFGVIDSSTPAPSGYTEEQLRTLVDNYRRQRDFFLIMDGLWYILQIVDAHVDAHLKEFDLNPQLKVSWRPEVRDHAITGRSTGFALTLTF